VTPSALLSFNAPLIRMTIDGQIAEPIARIRDLVEAS